MLKAAVLAIVAVGVLAAGMCAYEASAEQAVRRVESVGWMLDPGAELSPESRGVDVLYLDPACRGQGKLATKVEYRPTEIALGLVLNYVPGCLISVGPSVAHFELDEPLENRRLVPLDEPNLTPADFAAPQRPTTDPAFDNDPRL
jgi:hypothetical protein